MLAAEASFILTVRQAFVYAELSGRELDRQITRECSSIGPETDLLGRFQVQFGAMCYGRSHFPTIFARFGKGGSWNAQNADFAILKG